MSHNDQHNLDHLQQSGGTTVSPGDEGGVAAQWERQLKLAMGQLPASTPPPLEAGWQQLRQTLRARRRRRQQYPLWAAAAVLLLAFGVWRLWPPSALTGTGETVAGPVGAARYAASEQTGGPQPGELPANRPSASASAQELAVLMDMSRQLENEWQHLRQRQRTLSGAEMERQMQLAGLIASVDAKLTAQAAGYPPGSGPGGHSASGSAGDSASERQRSLWRQRVVLMNELVAGEVQAEPAVWTL